MPAPRAQPEQRSADRAAVPTAIQFLNHVLARLPFAVERIRTDNGQKFGSALHRHILGNGIEHSYIQRRTPRLNGRVERSHRRDSEEFYRLLEGQVVDDTPRFTEQFQKWEDYCNYHQPHESISGQTPYERLRQRTQDPLS